MGAERSDRRPWPQKKAKRRLAVRSGTARLDGRFLDRTARLNDVLEFLVRNNRGSARVRAPPAPGLGGSRARPRREPLAEIAASAGFADQSHFTRVFRRQVGTTPARYREQAQSRTFQNR
jgi:AraC-like DNA-binding protein